MVEEDDEIAWADEPSDTPVAMAASESARGDQLCAKAPLNVLIVDDDEEVHRVTLFTLTGLTIDGASVNFVHARSSEEAEAILATGQRFAVILLDVVMEDDESGFRLVRYIREELKERASRIIMRTGQPGSVPERDLILQYDINDYRNKTELTAMTLYTAVVTAARTFKDILRIEGNSRSLGQMMQNAKDIFSVQEDASVELVLNLAREQLSKTLGEGQSIGLYQISDDNRKALIQGDHASAFEEKLQQLGTNVVGVGVNDRVVSLGVEHGDSHYVFLGWSEYGLDSDSLHLLELLRKNIQTALDNLTLRERLYELRLNLQRFVPQKALGLFEVQDVRGLEIGRSFELDACILFMRLDVKSFQDFAVVEQGISDVVRIIHQYDGLVDKFTSDGLLAIFFHPERAGQDALSAIDDIDTLLNKPSNETKESLFDICFGVNFGSVTFGLVGYEERLELTVMGDPVNIAARMKAMCRILPCTALVSGEVIRRYHLEGANIRGLGRFHLRGRKESIECFEVLTGGERVALEYRTEFESVVAERPGGHRQDLWRDLALRYPNDRLIEYFHRYAGQRAPHEHSRMTDLMP